MFRSRRRRSWIVALWLIGQAASVAAISRAACDAVRADAPAACTCSHAGSGECPMHHAHRAQASRCSCRGSDSGAASAMLAMFGPSAVMPSAAGAASPVRDAIVASAAADAPCHRPSVPDPPPPRRPLV
ncbi:MAG TPA: hypothetical protein VFA27_01460 [Vicinamibacterales bacterium]|nr:hypothetical protein [Vicinamibacterales bacterium]